MTILHTTGHRNSFPIKAVIHLLGMNDNTNLKAVCPIVGVDACQGDSGGPASLKGANGRHYQVRKD